MKRIQTVFLSLALLCALLLSGCEGMLPSTISASYDLDDLPAYSGEPYVTVNGNEPFFTPEDLTTDSYETYSELDALGRCGVAWANVGVDLMPTEDRGSIGQVKPSGWHTVKYDVVDGKYLYNRCHLIGFQLTGENANEKNLITGTRYRGRACSAHHRRKSMFFLTDGSKLPVSIHSSVRPQAMMYPSIRAPHRCSQ